MYGFGTKLWVIQRTICINAEKKLIETTPEGVQMLDLLDKDINIVILNMLKEIKKTVPKELKDCITMMSHQIQNLKGREIMGTLIK